MKNNIKIILVFLTISIFVLSGCTDEEPVTGTLTVEPILLSGMDTEKLSLTKHYSLDSIDIELKTAQYQLPLQSSEISNYADFSGKIQLNEGALGLLNKNGFAVIKNPFYAKEEYITSPYKTLKDREIPVFITTDSLLHLYHIQFDETLRQIEEREFYDAIWNIDKKLLDESIEAYNGASGELKEAAKNNVAYFSVALSLLQPTSGQLCEGERWVCEGNDAYFTKEELEKYTFEIPGFVEGVVDEELELIEKHAGFSYSPIFIYKEDYSQYVPRGHYTRSEKLKNYFKGFMWHGRISMLLKKDLFIPDPDAEHYAKIQTMSASLIASEFAENNEVKDKWDRIYSVTAFYVGLSDDLGPYEYLEAMNKVFGDTFDANTLTVDNIHKLKAELVSYRTPEIYGGTGSGSGACQTPDFNMNPEQLDKCLEATKGFRLMGQRFIPDSYMFQNLVFSNVQDRFFPKGLDVMALLGSARAFELLEEQGDTTKDGYMDEYNKLKEEFNGFDEAEWNKNLYWSWLYALKPLLKDFDNGYPTFMQTKAWQDKELTAALASWTELRHDTILYAKQSYTMETTGMPPPPKPVVGYVEPVPEFYNRLLALTRMTNKGLDEMDVLDNAAKYRLKNLETILERLVEISKQELENKELAQDDYDFIKNFGEELNGVIADVDDKAKKTTIIADVHTDTNSGKVLEEGVGYVGMIVVAYKVPDGRVLLGAGPVMSYYEFKHPMSDRLTDEKWREMLKTNPPERPAWMVSFMHEK